ncbi:MAG TPA: hypothetical protein VFV19_01355 [Candidatus Polarisedimenticolaceae bacterium]|nr:hypothetical protein [Candidatus Polarisedimenticolaceae bacterium]
MGLAVVVGVLPELFEDDVEGAEWFRKALQSANELLAANGIPTHREPETALPESSRCPIDSYPYSFIHYLRRVYAHVTTDPNWQLRELGSDEDPVSDPVVQRETMRLKSHLLSHSDAEGFYFPVDFEEVLVDGSGKVPGAMVGSSVQLKRELVALAPYLGITLSEGELSDLEAEHLTQAIDAEGAFWIEKCVWLSLFEAARLSLKHGVAICFT